MPYQRRFRLRYAFDRSIPLPRHVPGNLRFGQPFQLHAPEFPDLSAKLARPGCPDDHFCLGNPPYGLVLTATCSGRELAAGVTRIEDGCAVGSTGNRKTAVRSIFAIQPVRPAVSAEERPSLGHEFFIQLLHAPDKLYLRSETPLIDGQFTPNHHNLVRLSQTNDGYAKWRALHWNRHKRFETEGAPITPCMRVVIQHVMTNQCLAVEPLNWYRSLLGYECGISVHTYSDVHRNETSECIWNFITEGEDDGHEIDLTKCQ